MSHDRGNLRKPASTGARPPSDEAERTPSMLPAMPNGYWAHYGLQPSRNTQAGSPPLRVPAGYWEHYGMAVPAQQQRSRGQAHAKNQLGEITYLTWQYAPVSAGFVIGGWETIEVFARDRAEWKEFLAKDANSKRGSVELNAFMALAVDRPTHALHGRSHAKINANIPTKENSLSLMDAYLSVGSKIAIVDRGFAREDGTRETIGPLLSSFVSRYATVAANRRCQGEGLELADIKAVTAFATAAHRVTPQGEKGTPGPVQRLMVSCMGVAVWAVAEIIEACKTRTTDRDRSNEKRREAYRKLENAALMIRSCLDQKESRPDPGLTALFHGAINALAAAVPGGTLVKSAVAGLTSAITSLLPELFNVDGKDEKRGLIDRFKKKVEKQAREHGLDAEITEIIKAKFQLALEY